MQAPSAFQEQIAPHQKAVLEQVDLMHARNRAAGLVDERMLYLMGELCASAGVNERAIFYLRECVGMGGASAPVLHALGRCLLAIEQASEAESVLRDCLRLAPGLADAHYQLGVALHWQARYGEALACYETAVSLQPGHAKARFNAAYVYLLRGDMERGWRLFQHRFHLENGLGQTRPRSPKWLGKADLRGKRLLVYAEQGLGDCLQYLRYVPMLSGRGARLILQVRPALLGLVREQGWDLELVSLDEPAPEHDWHCPLGSLPYVFGGAMVAAGGYLKVGAGGARFEERLAVPGILRVGLVWSGMAWFRLDRYRSIPAKQLDSLVSLEGCQFVSLQKDLKLEDEAWLGAQPGVLHSNALLEDFKATAELIMRLDLVIAVDTAVAHLAGALGKPVWILLPRINDWRWLLEGSDSPWYESARVFRQSTMGDWAPVLEATKARLELLQREHAGQPFPCRAGCGACCIAPSISTPIPSRADALTPPGYLALPGGGKPAGQACPQLDEDMRCRLFGKPERPQVCASLKPSLEMCGVCREEALAYLGRLEHSTKPV